MKEIKLTPTQHRWLCAKLEETFQSAAEQVRDLESPQTISYYSRNNADDIRLRNLADCKYMMQFCCEFKEAII